MIDVRLDFKALAEAGSMLVPARLLFATIRLHAGHGSQRRPFFIATSPAVNVFLVVWVRKK